jgi:hypothetical protein
MRNTWHTSISDTKAFALSMDCGQRVVEEEEIIVRHQTVLIIKST